MVLGDEAAGVVGTIVPVDTHQGGAGAQGLGEPLQLGCLLLAGRAPARPEVDQSRPSSKGGEIDPVPGEDLARKLGGGALWTRAAREDLRRRQASDGQEREAQSNRRSSARGPPPLRGASA